MFYQTQAAAGSASTAGFMIGPMIGGLMYNYGGFPVPFLVTGILSVMVAAASYKFVPKIGESNTDNGSPESRSMEHILYIYVYYVRLKEFRC
jgi:MFS family permease